MNEIILGIDAGVKNTGYAMVDENYNVIKVEGHNALGVLYYDEAKSAVDRRQFRANSRRLKRRQYRITLLQEIFNDELMKKDCNFLRRLSENDLHSDDRSVVGKYSLFNDGDFGDVQYYKKYPTIYHLRQELMNKECDDIRLLYLACHHIVKYRGHFLLNNDMENVDNNDFLDITDTFKQINKLLENRNLTIDEDDETVKIEEFYLGNLGRLKDFLSRKGEDYQQMLEQKQLQADEYSEQNGYKKKKVFLGRKEKETKVCELLEAKSKVQKTIVSTLFGGKVNISTIFGQNVYAKEDVKGFTFSDDLDSVADIQLLKTQMYDCDLIFLIKEVYNWVLLNDLLKGEKSISNAMVRLYETHKQDLKDLKYIIKHYASCEQYEKMFSCSTDDEQADKNKKFANYTEYIGGGMFNGEKVGHNGRIGETASTEDFYSKVKSVLEKINAPEALELKESILTRIESGEFMPKIVSKNNSAIPYQLNMLELNMILNTAINSGKYTFLTDVTDGCTNADKIKKLLSFRIPYYVGPVKNYSKINKESHVYSKNAWAVRNSDDRVTPWNIDKVIDVSKSGEEFIKRMTNQCTYLKGESAKALPKNSILFSKFNCLNEINSIKINGTPITVNAKQGIFDNVFMTGKPTLKRIYSYLINELKYDKDIKITGIDKDIKSNMNSYLIYKNVLGDIVDKNPKLVERLIFLSTIHNDSKIIEKCIRTEFGSSLTEEQIKSVKGFTFKGWGSLSAEFLAGYKNNGIKIIFDGEYIDIIDILYYTNMNLQQILFDKRCNFEQALEDYNKEKGIVSDDKITYEFVENMYCSPAVKRGVWQIFKLVKDLVKQTKCIPDKIFLESCRTNDDFDKKKRTKTRREQILELYKEAEKQSKALTKDMEECKSLLNNKSDAELKSEKLYLYFKQLGRCLYTNEKIELEDLPNDNICDVDHIIPQAKIKDDSLDNKALVKQYANKEKGDKYPLEDKFRQHDLWKNLKQMGLLNDEKYSRLIRKEPISDEEQEKFINRQLVETNQMVVAVRDILKKYFDTLDHEKYTKLIPDKNVEIVFSRASNVSDFRKNYSLVKSREVNDFHHACDAYLNTVVGDILNKKFNHNWNYKNNETNQDKSYNFQKVLKNAVEKDDAKILKTIKEQIDTRDFQVVKQIRENKGELYKATIYPAEDKKNSALIPRCESKIVDGVETHPKCDTEKYGGYKTSGTAYFVVVDYEGKKNEQIRSIEPVSILDNIRLKNGKTTYAEIFEKRGLKNARLANINGLKESKIKVGSLLDFGKYRLRLTGSNERNLLFHNANQLYVTEAINRYVKEISIIVEKANKKAKNITKDKEIELVKIAGELIDENIKRKSRSNQHSDIEIVTKDKNVGLYTFCIERLSKHPYKDIPSYSSLLNILEKAKDDFTSKDIYTQMTILLNIIQAFHCGANQVNVSKLSYVEVDKNGKEKVKNGGAHQCSITRNKKITDDKIVFVSQSQSGLKEVRIPLYQL